MTKINNDQFVLRCQSNEDVLLQASTADVLSNDAYCGDTTFPQAAVVKQLLEYEGMVPTITTDEAIQLEEATRSQAASNLWFKERSRRITASNFGYFMKTRKEVNEPFLKKIFPEHTTNKPSGQACEYGKKNEVNAKEAYVKKLTHQGVSVHVHDCGLIINPNFPFLGASPDGKVCKDGVCGIIEVKCPFSAKGLNIQEAVSI